MTGHKKEVIKIPKHLKSSTKRWFKEICETYELESHHEKLLLLAAEAWERCQEARVAIGKFGNIYKDKFGQPKTRPEIGI